MENKKIGASWKVIIVWLILFFPVGIFLMISKLHKDIFNFIDNGKRTIIVGWVFVGIFVIGMFSSDNPGMSLILAALSYLMVWDGKRYQDYGLIIEKYKAVIYSNEGGYIDDIAATLNENYNVVYDNIQEMIDNGIFPNSYINENERRLISPYLKHSTPLQRDTSPKTIKCPNCGGMNEFKYNEEMICEYCGSHLEV